MTMEPHTESWRTKPTDRFVLKWIKLNLSARITPHLLDVEWLRPWMITLFSASLGVLGGLVFALGWGWLAGTIAACAQVLDGVDGQFARYTGRQTREGAFWDSVLDRYADGSMAIGLVVYLFGLPGHPPAWVLLVLAFLAIAGSNLISYSSARAESLGLDLGKPTLASKGTRTSVMILSAWGSLFVPMLPLAALVYLAVHPNLAVIARLTRTLPGR
ncbi:MAG: CDP-alcohol phosphatidyltransferase family protein [Acidobacteriota bacterium]